MAHRELDHYIEGENETQIVDWEQELDWENDEQLKEAGFYLSGEEKLSNREELNPEKLKYTYKWYDWQAAAHNSDNTKKRSEFFKSKEVSVYPDEMVWVRDFSYSYNEPMTRNYFWHPAYDDYPVVGVNWHMANAFSYWRTQLYNAALEGEKEIISTEDFRLPTEHEWEYAARGGLVQTMYSWGDKPEVDGKPMCNNWQGKFPNENTAADGFAFSSPAKSFPPNGFQLYDMAGNVWELCSDLYDPDYFKTSPKDNPKGPDTWVNRETGERSD